MTCVDRGCPRLLANPPKNPYMHSLITNTEEAALGLQLPSCICQITTVGGWEVFRLTNRKKLGSPEYHLRADVEKNGNFWTPTAWVNVPKQTAFPGQTAWLSRLRQQQPPCSVKSRSTENCFSGDSESVWCKVTEGNARNYLSRTERRWSRKCKHICWEPRIGLRWDSHSRKQLEERKTRECTNNDTTLYIETTVNLIFPGLYRDCLAVAILTTIYNGYDNSAVVKLIAEMWENHDTSTAEII